MTTSGTKANPRLDALHGEFERLGLRGYWQLRMTQERTQPRLWRWADIYPSLMEAGEVVRLGPDAFRRNVGLKTGTKTVSMGFQIVLPGERAAAHRHTASALRFVVQGRGAYTTSNGEQMVMEPGDLLIQPNWTWHDHANLTSEPIIWIDMLDGGLANFLEVTFREEWAEGEYQPITKSDGYSRRVFGAARPRGGEGVPGFIPFNYKWTEALRALEELAAAGDADPHDGVILEYTNPLNGGPTFLTMTCHLQLLRPGETTRFHRHTGTTLYHAVQGQGATTVDKENPLEMAWEEKASFVLPSWRWHRHQNRSRSEPTILFSVTDRPVVQAVGMHREEGS